MFTTPATEEVIQQYHIFWSPNICTLAGKAFRTQLFQSVQNRARCPIFPYVYMHDPLFNKKSNKLKLIDSSVLLFICLWL